ncbi:hypothetical protein SO802_017960 [Lithocarpus litseifolius]|uniref:RNase H type-1 domain-containing protein n=1 Tax=Lithocarpus litseifolius TaxID=425828 RepID=A0AAW2CLU1_9ROSI
MAFLSHSISPPLTVIETETMATARALEFAQELGLDSAILEGDCEVLMNSLKEDSQHLASSGLLIEDVKAIAESFQCISFSHVRNVGNMVAHNLARHASHVTSFSVWIEDIPSHTLVAYQLPTGGWLSWSGLLPLLVRFGVRVLPTASGWWASLVRGVLRNEVTLTRSG